MKNTLAFCTTALVSIKIEYYNQMTLEFAATVVNEKCFFLVCQNINANKNRLF